LHKDVSRTSLLDYNNGRSNFEQQIETLTKEKEKIDKFAKELELEKNQTRKAS
jgi:hypothetical protein